MQYAFNFDSSISHLHNALQQISSWMAAITVNFFKTEFLLIGLISQLAKIHNSLLDTSHSARNLGFIFNEHLIPSLANRLNKKPVSQILPL